MTAQGWKDVAESGDWLLRAVMEAMGCRMDQDPVIFARDLRARADAPTPNPGGIVSSPMYDLPEHLRIGVTIDGRGPVDLSDHAFHHWACWCGVPECALYLEPAHRLLPGAEALLDFPDITGAPGPTPLLGDGAIRGSTPLPG